MSEAPEGAAEAVTEDTAAAITEATEETQAQGDEQSGDDAAAAAETDPPAEQPKKKTAQERINELTREKHDIAREKDRDIEYWKAKALQSGSQPAQEAQQEPQGDGRPDRADYEDDFEFIEALTDWKADRAAERLSLQHRQQERTRTVRDSFETRAKTLFPDGEPAGLEAFRRLPQLPVAVLEIVGESDIGPKLADHLGANPAELRRLEGLSTVQQARELTRLEARLSEPPKPASRTVTEAPEPLPTVRGAGGRFAVPPDTNDFAAFQKAHGGT